jgi:hypothetical protein
VVRHVQNQILTHDGQTDHAYFSLCHVCAPFRFKHIVKQIPKGTSIIATILPCADNKQVMLTDELCLTRNLAMLAPKRKSDEILKVCHAKDGKKAILPMITHQNLPGLVKLGFS